MLPPSAPIKLVFPPRPRRPSGPLVVETFVVRAQCETGHEWRTILERSYHDSGARRPRMTGELDVPRCPTCGKDFVNYSNLSHGRTLP